MSKARVLAALLSITGLVVPGVSRGLICETIGTGAARFDLVAADKVVTKPRIPYGGVYYYGCNSNGIDLGEDATCSTSVKLRNAAVDSITATQSTGTAVRFRDGGEFECGNSYAGQIVTGGGAVALRDVSSNTTDETGTHPAVTGCTDAIAQLKTASAAFAAMPPVRTYNRILIKRGTEFVLDTTDAGVINIESLVMEGVPVEPQGYGGYEYRTGSCLSNYNAGGGPAVLRIEGNSLDDVVLNVGNLEIGGCAEVYADAPVLFNVHGRGRKVKIGISAFVLGDLSAPDILAPERTVYVVGGRQDLGTPIAGLYARKLISLGYVYTFDPLCKTCGYTGLNPGEACDGAAGCPPGFYCDQTCSACGTTRCGDGIKVGTESCDRSDGCPPGLYCNSSCTACTQTQCGDGIIAGSEPCDGALGCTAPEVCNPTCTACTTCGNNVVDGSETCDGALGCSAGTYCNSQCSTCFTQCGDGIVAGSEVCDRNGNVGCNPAGGTSCNSSCSACITTCGDGIVAGSEVCDYNGNVGCGSGTSCNFSCSACNAQCGDGLVAGSEVCDRNGNVGCGSGTSCNSSCSACAVRCGDGIVGGSEVCDGSAGCSGGICHSSCSVCTSCPETVIPAGGGTVSGTTTGGHLLLTSGCGGAGPERTFAWTPAVSGTATIDLCGSSYDTVLYIRQGGCNGTQLACSNDSCGFRSRITPSVTAGQTYTIVVDGYNGASGSFVLNVTPPAP